MLWWILLRKTLRDLLARKAALTGLILIMAFGGAAFVGFLSIHRDQEAAIHRYYAAQRLPDVQVELRRAPMAVAQEVAQWPNVAGVRARINLPALVDLPGRPEPIGGQVLSLPFDPQPILNDVLLVTGTWFSTEEGREVLVNDAFARANGLRVGDRLSVLLLDKQHDLLIIGTVISPEFVYLLPAGGGLAPDPARFGAVYVPERFLQESGDLDGACNQLLITLHDDSAPALRETLALLRDRLDEYGVSLTSWVMELSSPNFLRNEMDNLKKTSTITPVIAFSVAALMLNVLMARLVAQQRGVIGTFKALGFSSWLIFAHYVGYGAVVGALGGLGGCLMGLWIHSSMLSLYRQIYSLPSLPMHLHWDLYLLGIGICALAAAAGTLKGVHAAASLQPAEAMHPPPPEVGRRLPFESLGLFQHLPFQAKLVLRDIFRNPFRSLVSIIAGTVSTMMVFGSLCMRDALLEMTRHEYFSVIRYDYAVSLRDPRGEGLAREEALHPGLEVMERELMVPCDLSNGNREKRVSITAYRPDATLRLPQDKDGHRIAVPETGVVLTRKLAEILSVAPGDRILVQPLLGERRQASVPVTGIVDSYVGLSAYASLETMSRLLGEEAVANQLLMRLAPGADANALLGLWKERAPVTGMGERLRSYHQIEETFSRVNLVVISIFVLFAMLIGFGAMLNAALVSLSERQREVATLRTIGYLPQEVARLLGAEMLILYGIGLVLGIPAGIRYVHFLAWAYSSEIFRMPVVLHTDRMVQAVVIAVLSMAVAQYIVYRLIARLNWLEALKIKE